MTRSSVRDDGGGGAPPSGVARSRGLAAALIVELSDAARVLIDDVGGGTSVDVVPYRVGARSVRWVDFGDEIIVQVGDFGGRWELSGNEAVWRFWRTSSARW